MTTFLSILAAVVILSLFVTLHEMGHFIAGRKLGFDILEFAVGMGPVIFKKEKDGITYSLRALPIGGMCRFYGEDEETGDGRAFSSHPVWKRMIVIVAGAFMNLLTAIVLASVLLMAYGDYAPQVDSFTFENSPAEEAGMLPGDVITAVDGERVQLYSGYSMVSSMLAEADSDEVSISVLRNGETVDLTLHDIYDATEGRNIIGIQMTITRVRYGFFPAIGNSFEYIWQMIKAMLQFIGSLFHGEVQRTDVTGPVGIISLIGQAVRTSFETVLIFAVLISANIGLFNLLPLPALDGGRFVFLVIEAIIGKPVPIKVEATVHFIGIILLLGLVLFLTVGDVSTLIGSIKGG